MKKNLVVHLTSVHRSSDLRIFHRECRSLAQDNYDVLLIAPHDRNEVIEGVRIRALPKPKNRLDRMTRVAWAAYREATRQPADIYHFHDPELLGAGLLLRARGKKVIYDIHENVPKSIMNKHYLPKWLRRPVAWIVDRVECFACRRFSALVPAAPSIEQRVRTLNPRVVTIHNFPIAQDMRPASNIPWSGRSPSVAYVGGIDIRRGIREMIEAMNLLPEELHAKLKLAGPFFPPRLQDEVRRIPGWKRVDALGVLELPAVMNLLSRVRAGLVLIHHPLSRFQAGQPVKMFEYMAMGLPVIASDCPQWREIIEGFGCGLLVDPAKPQAIAEAIEYVLSRPEEAESMGRRGRQAVESAFNWEAEQHKLLQLYANLLKPGNIPAHSRPEQVEDASTARDMTTFQTQHK